ncbi:MAG TPA: hypothetical protein IAB00_05150, partial [Candidatus Avidehalobacter gallistercoris]|nr:hypothetical protein [Candidatus Avidehalobacter gallistercoris]
MAVLQRISVLLIFVDMLLAFPLSPLMLSLSERYYTLLNYPMAEVISPFYDIHFTAICLYGHLVIIPAFILAYICKRRCFVNAFFATGLVFMALVLLIAFNEHYFAARAEKYYNPETVQSTMVEIDLQQLEDLQDSTEETMIYFGRPSCAHCNEIKPNLDILVNNSHSLVYYYNTEQDREDNHDAMQAVLD